MAVYYKLSDGTNSFIFVPNGLTPTNTRDVWEQALPFVQDKWLLDQTTTSRELAQQFICKTGTGFPYTTFALAIAALESLSPADRTTGWSLQGGDWNGSSWTVNSAYPAFGTGSTKIINATVSYTLAPGENFTNGVLTGSINMKIGLIF